VRLPDGRIYASSWTPPPTYEHRLNGKLVLRYSGEDDTGHQTGWSDGKVQRVEDRLHRFVEALLEAGERSRLDRIEAERREQRFREEQARREEATRLRQEEEERVTKLRASLAAWREVRDVRAFVEEANAIAAAAGRGINLESTLGKFLTWATRWSNQADPLLALRNEIAKSDARPAERSAGPP
jgi:hypothetical protein